MRSILTFFAFALVSLALPAQKKFSQQANILAVLYDVVPKERPQEELRRLLAAHSRTQQDQAAVTQGRRIANSR